MSERVFERANDGTRTRRATRWLRVQSHAVTAEAASTPRDVLAALDHVPRSRLATVPTALERGLAIRLVKALLLTTVLYSSGPVTPLMQNRPLVVE